MAGIDFRLPGVEKPLESPEFFITGVLRNFHNASQALGAAVETLVLRIGRPGESGDPDYQIGTQDGEDAAVFSGENHDFKYDDITVHIEEKDLMDQPFTAEQVKDWLNTVNGEGTGGGALNPILTEKWRETDPSDPRD